MNKRVKKQRKVTMVTIQVGLTGRGEIDKENTGETDMGTDKENVGGKIRPSFRGKRWGKVLGGTTVPAFPFPLLLLLLLLLSYLLNLVLHLLCLLLLPTLLPLQHG